MSLADQCRRRIADEPTRLGLRVHGQLRSCNSGVGDLHHCGGRLHRDGDLNGSVDHAQCCTLRATAKSWYRRGSQRSDLSKNDRSGNGIELELSENKKIPLFSIKTQQREDSFLRWSWRGRSKSPSFSITDKRKGSWSNKNGCVLSSAQR